MSYILRDSLAELRDDPFRRDFPFSPDVRDATVGLLEAGGDATATGKVLSTWLASHQPCLFGRITARLGGLHYCFLLESDLLDSDEAVRDKIQDSRRGWRRKAFAGDASGFVILVISERLANAVPDDIVRRIAKRLCLLYLGDDREDEILLEDVFLRVPGKEDAEIHWKAGVNYFCAQGDQRWWHDHRIPGGLGLSINSVGHLVRSFQIARSAEEMWKKAGLSQEEWANFKVSSLGQALVFAMQTIDGAANTVSGKATELLPANRQNAGELKCPVELPRKLMDRDCSQYFGYYHTDFTLPSDYFRADIERPSDVEGNLLDLTYLFKDEIDNPAFKSMGTGIRVRARRSDRRQADGARQRDIRRMVGEEGLISQQPALKEALQGFQ